MRKSTLVLGIIFLMFTAFAHADCPSGIFDTEQATVGGTGTLLVTCFNDEKGWKEYSVFDGTNYTVIGNFEDTTKVKLAVNGQPETLAKPQNINFFLNRRVTVTALVKSGEPQSVLEANVVVELNDPPAPETTAEVYKELTVMPVADLRAIEVVYANPNSSYERLRLRTIVSKTVAEQYKFDGDDWRLENGRGPKGWVPIMATIEEPFLQDTNFLTYVQWKTERELWQNDDIPAALDRATSEEDRRKILRAALKEIK